MRTCPCGIEELVHVHIDADLACEGHEKWKTVGIDKCIASIVKALQKAGINMRGSCCGHGKASGRIDLSDGRVIEIYPDGQATQSLLYACQTVLPFLRDLVKRPRSSASAQRIGSDAEAILPVIANAIAKAEGKT